MMTKYFISLCEWSLDENKYTVSDFSRHFLKIYSNISQNGKK